MAAVVVTTRATAVRVTILAAIFPAVFAPVFAAILTPVFPAIFPAVLAARGLVGLAGHGGRGQQRTGDEQSRTQL
jgi:hypothetical protein